MRIIPKVLLSACFGALALVLALACGGGGNGGGGGNPFPVIVSITPTSATLPVGGTQPFSASVTGGTLDTAVIWSVQETGGGTVNASGLYTAPPSVDATSTIHVVATSHGETTKSASAVVTVERVIISVSPSTAKVDPGATEQFTATVLGPTNKDVTWTKDGGELSATTGATVIWTAPTEPGTYFITARSEAAPNPTDTAMVIVPEQY